MIQVNKAHMQVAAATHPGMRGKNNEDRHSIQAFESGEGDGRRSLLVVVSDGVGGHQAGEIAAEIAVHEVTRCVAESDASRPLPTLVEAFKSASREIRVQARTRSEQVGMAATCVSAWVIEDRLYAASAGDSRLYLLRGGSIQQLTTDHTWIQEALDRGVITSEDAAGHPNMHVIRRYLGSEKTVTPDTQLRLQSSPGELAIDPQQGFQLLPGDLLVLSTDGLTDLVTDDEIQAAFQTNDLQQAIDQLIELANQRGGHDNITIAAARLPATYTRLPAVPASEKRQVRYLPLLIIGGVIACLAIAVLIYFLYQISSPLLGFGT